MAHDSNHITFYIRCNIIAVIDLSYCIISTKYQIQSIIAVIKCHRLFNVYSLMSYWRTNYQWSRYKRSLIMWPRLIALVVQTDLRNERHRSAIVIAGFMLAECRAIFNSPPATRSFFCVLSFSIYECYIVLRRDSRDMDSQKNRNVGEPHQNRNLNARPLSGSCTGKRQVKIDVIRARRWDPMRWQKAGIRAAYLPKRT